MNFYIETLGCARNQVDSEVVAGRLIQIGFSLVDDPSLASLIVINTCSFINSAAEESVDVILELSEFKKDGICNKIIVIGCLPERYGKKIVDILPEVDFFLGTGAFDKIDLVLNYNLKNRGCFLPDPNNLIFNESNIRKRESLYTSYLKISEGCDRNCSYCIIPKLKGSQRSRSMAQIISEAEDLILSGVREITLVAQDTTNYGRDLSNKQGLDILLRNLANLSKDVWIRFLYGHPDSINESLIATVGKYDNLCSYFDLPIQHVSAKVLKNMKRYSNKRHLTSLFKKIRTIVPNAALRSTVIVGFPGESDSDFMELYDFLDEIKFDNLGVFKYSDSQDLESHILKNHVKERIVSNRYDNLMAKQMGISSSKLNYFLGQTVDVLIESFSEHNIYEGRSMLQAPEVDGIIYVKVNQENKKLELGDIISVKITDSLEYDLIGEPYE